jgi:hypothetical protein
MLFKEWWKNYKKDSLPIPRLDIADYVSPVSVQWLVAVVS